MSQNRTQLSTEEAAKRAAKYLNNMTVDINDEGTAKLLSAVSKFITRQQAENQALRKELADLKEAIPQNQAESDAKIRKDINLVKKVLERTRLRVVAEKKLTMTFSAAVRGDIDSLQQLLDRVAASRMQKALPKKENTP